MKINARSMFVEDDYIVFKDLFKTYQSTVKSFIYAMLDIRPDIVFVVLMISRYIINFIDAYHVMIKRIFRYLRVTINWHLIYQGSLKNFINYIDSDWADDYDIRKSISKYIYNLRSEAISWSFKRQIIVALFIYEIEYID